ncbi:hypothetical protein QQS21_002375 [Conoideocrella luteorostrata]|uniref:Probable alpha/beta-glucosidase agdC n=1 Tax=Conoideocrella luteorostrata TaxID=1105319 RepID=A0AAJ0CYG7_9HYPO|nr:hypothetical protein QQS21_002375 [Conoideocrella luteorostrata]
MMQTHNLVRFLALSGLQLAAAVDANGADALAKCPGYKASNIKTTGHGLKADLHLAGPKCNAYGTDLDDLKLDVTVETSDRVHVKIYDAAEHVYQVPESVFPRPKPAKGCSTNAALKFDYTENPFSFRILRTETKEVLFDSSAAGLVMEDQYLRLRTHLPTDTNLYGLGEHSDSLRLKTTNYTRTLWNADMPSIPNNRNLYGSHPVYIEHRTSGSHGVFLLSSNGMDIFIDKDKNGQYLEYNILGGVFDFYFMAGPTPIDVTKQYAEIAGLPVTVPYSGLGFHHCRWGYQDAFAVAEAVYNYSKAGIPLETMWTDIDYMDARAIFSLDPQRFPLKVMRELVAHLHANKQKYVVMVDPAVAAKNYGPYNNGVKDDIFILNSTKQTFHGVVWPGLTAYPDWFADGVQQYWNKEFAEFFSPESGLDIDFLWIDMNEPANFCDFPCLDPVAAAKEYPPPAPAVRHPPRDLPGWPCDFQPPGTSCKRVLSEQRLSPPADLDDEAKEFVMVSSRDNEAESSHTSKKWKGLPNRELISPPYKIHNFWGPLPHKSINTSLVHHNGLTLFDTHNLYGTMMSAASRQAMLARRPSKRPLVITRSTFAGAGSHVSHWLGDNDSDWPHYRWSISGMLQFASIFQVSMVGSDVCGFNGNTTEELCARWSSLGAFQPFYRNHNAEGMIDQEFYVWKSVTEAARRAIDIRYRLLDYFYTAMMRQSQDGTPAMNPMFYIYSNDKNTFGLDLQFFWGPSLLVAPVTEQGSTSVDIYLPDDIFYDFYTHEQIRGEGKNITKRDQGLADIPLFFRGGVIVPLRIKSAMTTTDLREQDFELVIPVGKDGTAKGALYLDDGDSLKPDATSNIEFEYKKGQLAVNGSFGYKTKAKIAKVTLLGVSSSQSGEAGSSGSITVDKPLTQPFTVQV